MQNNKSVSLGSIIGDVFIWEVSLLIELRTWSGKSSFKYVGSVKTGTKIIYGSNQETKVSAEQYFKLLSIFKGRTVPIGTLRCSPPRDSIGSWIRDNVVNRSLVSYIGPILIREGYAEKIGSEIHVF